MQSVRLLIIFCLLMLFNDLIAQTSIDIPLKLKKTIGSLDENPARDQLLLTRPTSIVKDQHSNFYILDTGIAKILKLSPDYRVISEIGRVGQGPGEFHFVRVTNPGFLSLHPNGMITVFSNRDYRVQTFDSTGTYINEFKTAFTMQKICVDLNENLHIASFSPTDTNLIHTFTSQGNYLRSFAKRIVMNQKNEGLNEIQIAIDRNRDELYVMFSYWPIIQKYSIDGTKIWQKEVDLKGFSAKLDQMLKEGISKKPDQFERGLMPNKNNCHYYWMNIEFERDKLYLFHYKGLILEVGRDCALRQCYYIPNYKYRDILSAQVIDGEFYYLSHRNAVIQIYAK